MYDATFEDADCVSITGYVFPLAKNVTSETKHYPADRQTDEERAGISQAKSPDLQRPQCKTQSDDEKHQHKGIHSK